MPQGCSESQLSIVQLNCQGLCSSLTDVMTMCRQIRPDVLGLCETFLSRQTDILVDIPGYTSNFVHRQESARGGLAIYTKSEYPVCVNGKLTRNIEGIFESLFLDMSLPSQRKVIVGEIYRSPSGSVSSFTEYLLETLQMIEKQNHDVVIMGDFNINLAYPLTNSANDLLTLMSGFNLYPSTTIPTRVTESTHSLIDNIFSTLPPLSASVILSDMSDHFPLCTVFKTSKATRSFSKTRDDIPVVDLSEENLRLLNEELEKTTWDSVMDKEDLNEGFENFHSTFTTLYEACCFKEKIKKRGRKNAPICPWVTESLLRCINKKNNLWAEYRNLPNVASLRSYEIYKKCLRSVLRKAKRDYFNQRLAESGKDGRKVWKTVNSVLRPNNQQPELPSKITVDGETLTEPAQVAKALCTFFAKIGEKTANTALPPRKSYRDFLGPACVKSMALIPVTSTDVSMIVKGLRGASASGFDRVHTKVLKAVLPSVVQPLTHLVNLSLETGVFPSLLKKARIIPLHKGGPQDDPSNFRPISILSVFSKVFEKPMKNQLYSFLEAKGFLNQRQFGFRPGHSTEDALASLSLFINKALDLGLVPAAILLDIKKAFDSMDHGILLGKIEHIGVRGEALRWFRSYLSSRRVYIGDDPLNDTVVNFGVPQGSILGPLLFLVHVNDLSRVLNPNSRTSRCCKLCCDPEISSNDHESDELVAFADDTTMASCDTDMSALQSKLEVILEETYIWMDANRFVINVDKSCALFFSRIGPLRPEVSGITTSRGTIRRPKTGYARYLGVLLDEKLSFVHHIHAVELKLSRNLGIIRKLKHTFPQKTLRLLYNGLIKPHLQYCASIWQSTFTSHLKRLDSIHKHALKIIGNMDDFLSRESLYHLSCSVIVFKFFSGLLPSAFHSLFQLVSEQHPRNTRSASNLLVRRTPTVRSDFAPDVACAKVWNMLPQELRCRSSLGSFKNNLKKYLIECSINRVY